MASDYSIIWEMIKSGVILSILIGILYGIYWVIKNNIKYLYHKLTDKDNELRDWLIDGLKKGYSDEALSSVLMDKNYKINKILKSLKKAKNQMKKETGKKENKQLKLENLNKI